MLPLRPVSTPPMLHLSLSLSLSAVLLVASGPEGDARTTPCSSNLERRHVSLKDDRCWSLSTVYLTVGQFCGENVCQSGRCEVRAFNTLSYITYWHCACDNKDTPGDPRGSVPVCFRYRLLDSQTGQFTEGCSQTSCYPTTQTCTTSMQDPHGPCSCQ